MKSLRRCIYKYKRNPIRFIFIRCWPNKRMPRNLWFTILRNNLYAISLLNNEHENQKISDYIKRLTHSSPLKVSMRVCENDFLNAVFNRYSQRCEHLHITLDIDIRKQALTFMDKYDMISLFCNLLDNAVEAATGYPDAFIEVYAGFSRSHNLFLLSVKNSCMQKTILRYKRSIKNAKISKWHSRYRTEKCSPCSEKIWRKLRILLRWSESYFLYRYYTDKFRRKKVRTRRTSHSPGSFSIHYFPKHNCCSSADCIWHYQIGLNFL